MGKLKSIWQVFTGKSIVLPALEGEAWGANDKYMVDFRPERFGNFSVGDDGDMESSKRPPEPRAEAEEDGERIKVPVTPKAVLGELGRKPTNWSLQGLEDKLAILKDKRELITQRFAAKEVDGLMDCLRARKKYDHRSKKAKTTYREFFGRFDATDHDKVTAFLKKHRLVMKDADIFIPEFPDVAVRQMKIYTATVEELTGKKPRYFVIATKDQFRDADGKRDPILLAQSPFGFYYYILGAWDKEMLNLNEL